MKESPGKILIIVENLPLPFDRRVWMESNTLKKEGYDVYLQRDGECSEYSVADRLEVVQGFPEVQNQKPAQPGDILLP